MSKPFIVVVRHGPRKDDAEYSADANSDYKGNVPISKEDNSTQVIESAALSMKQALGSLLGRPVESNDLQFVVSPFERCLQTCEIIKSVLGASGDDKRDIVDPDFGEVFGPLRIKEMKDEYVAPLKKMLQEKVTATDKGGKLKKQTSWNESIEMAHNRYQKAFDEYSTAKQSSPIIIIVSHGDSLAAILHAYCTLYSVDYAGFAIFNDKVPIAQNRLQYLDPISSLSWQEIETLAKAPNEFSQDRLSPRQQPTRERDAAPIDRENVEPQKAEVSPRRPMPIHQIDQVTDKQSLFISHLKALETQTKRLMERRDKAKRDSKNYRKLDAAYDKANTLHTKIEEASTQYFAKNMTYEEFKKCVDDGIKEAKPVLEDHRGSKAVLEVLANISLILLSLFRSVWNGKLTLFKLDTDSMKAVNAVQDSTNKAAP